jgi:hypothetical protein
MLLLNGTLVFTILGKHIRQAKTRQNKTRQGKSKAREEKRRHDDNKIRREQDKARRDNNKTNHITLELRTKCPFLFSSVFCFIPRRELLELYIPPHSPDILDLGKLRQGSSLRQHPTQDKQDKRQDKTQNTKEKARKKTNTSTRQDKTRQ